jgi:hypothetical protein
VAGFVGVGGSLALGGLNQLEGGANASAGVVFGGADADVIGPRFTLGLRATLASAVASAVGPGEVQVERAWGAATVGVSLPFSSTTWLSLSGGPLFAREGASSIGFTANRSATYYDPGVWLAVALQEEVGAGFYGEVLAGTAILVHTESFSITNVGTILTLPPTVEELGFSLGWRFL